MRSRAFACWPPAISLYYPTEVVFTSPSERGSRGVGHFARSQVPKRFRDRWGPDCIREYRAAARQRFDDALELAIQGRRTGAIYLWGYSAEMLLKAAYFSLRGMAETAPITIRADINPAIQHGRTTHSIAWSSHGSGHDVRSWAELLVLERVAMPGRAYPADIARQVQVCGQRIGLLWSETLRYRKNIAYEYELRQVREAAEWLLSHSDIL